jgi:hypothetical protein
MRRILAEQVIRARDQNKVFLELANSSPSSPREVEERYDIDRGKGNAFVEFDAEPHEIGTKYNERIQLQEYFITGNVNLGGRNTVGAENRS